MGAPLRKVAILIWLLLLLAALVATGSKTIDEWLVILVWSALLIGSVILLVKNAQQATKNRGFSFGQVAVLPRSWQRWILGEEGPSKTDDHSSADKWDAGRQ
jgi:hypothetical protein